MDKFRKRKSVSDQTPFVKDDAREPIGSSSKISELDNLPIIPMDPGLELPPIQNEYHKRMIIAIQGMGYLLHQGLAFRGNEVEDTSDLQVPLLGMMDLRNIYLEGIKEVVVHDDPESMIDVFREGFEKVVRQDHSENFILSAPDVQFDIVSAAATETINVILGDLGGSLFSIIIGQSWDKEDDIHMSVVLRYMDKSGCAIERFLGIINITGSTPISLKTKLDAFLCKYGFSMSKLRGYGSSNLKSKFYGVKSLILKENNSAFYCHCFAHQLHMELINVAWDHNPKIWELFELISDAAKIVGESCKHLDLLTKDEAAKLIEKLKCDELSTGERFNQETNLRRFGEAITSPHYGALRDLLPIFSSVLDMLELVADRDINLGIKETAESIKLLDSMMSFEFIFNLHLMKNILGITNDLSRSLEQRDRDIANAVNLIKISKERMKNMRINGWDDFLAEVSSFCLNNLIDVPQMDDKFAVQGRSRNQAVAVTNLDYYQDRVYYLCIDKQLEELDHRFDEVNTEILLCMSSLTPSNSFAAYDEQQLIRLAKFYPNDFSSTDLTVLRNQLEIYISDMRSNVEFSKLDGISDLVKKMVETKKDVIYPLVFLLMTLSMTLPIATPKVESAYSATSAVKKLLKSRVGDEWMNHCLVTYIEGDVLYRVDTKVIMRRFEEIRLSRGQL